MTNKENYMSQRLQAYVAPKTMRFLEEKANEKGKSLSKFTSEILEDFATNSTAERVFRARILEILGQILSCVYDKEISHANAKLTQEILDLITVECKKTYS